MSHDPADALATPGVERVEVLEPFQPPHGFQALGGVAIVARDTWSAFQGRSRLKVTWEPGPNAGYDSGDFRRQLEETARKPGIVVRKRGDVDSALAGAARTHEADYYCPHLAHASMEPPVALAHTTADACEAWAPTQNPQAAQQELARALGIPREKVTVHVTLLGGGFGRKSKPDFIAEAALLSRKVGAPVKVVWTREDDIRHDYYHSVAALHMKAALDGDGRPTAMLMRTVFPTISSTFAPGAKSPSDGELGLGFTDLPFSVPNLRLEKGEAPAHVRIGWLRSVSNVYHAFAIGSFADELAVLAGRDRRAYLEELIGPDRLVDPRTEGAAYDNYGSSMETFPIDTARLKRVLAVACEKAGWGRELPRGRGLGLAVHRSFLTYVATVVEVDVAKDGRLSIPRVDVAVDCGLAVNPDRVRAQMEGSMVFGTSLALFGEITAREGRIQQSNFDDYRVARIHEAPARIEVHLVPHDAPPAGVGEPGVPPFAPALTSAIQAAIGKRIRALPLAGQDLSWS